MQIVGFPMRRLICEICHSKMVKFSRVSQPEETKTCLLRWMLDLRYLMQKKNSTTHQDPVVQSIVSLTISLRHKFVKQISAKVTNTLLFFVEKM